MTGTQNKRFSITVIKQSFVVFTGKFGGAGLGYIISLIVARILGPEQFGLFSFFVTLTILGSSLIGDAFAHAIVRHFVLYKKDPGKIPGSALLNALAIRILVGVPVIIIGLVFGKQLALNLFSDPQYTTPIILGCIGGFAVAIWTFALTILQATESFNVYAFSTPAVNLLRLLSIPVLISIGLLTLDAIILLYVVFYLLCGIVGIWFLRQHLKGARLNFSEIKAQLSFSKWMAIAIICFLLKTHLSIPALGYYSTKYEVGIYAASASLLIVIDHLTTAILTVQYPKIAKLDDLASQKQFAKQSFNFSIIIVIFLSPGLLIIEPVISLLYGPTYLESVPVFQILFIGLLAALISQPLNLIFLAQNKSHYWSITSAISLLTWIVASFFLIPKMGAIGAALTTTIARFSYVGISALLLFRTLYSKNANTVKIPIT